MAKTNFEKFKEALTLEDVAEIIQDKNYATFCPHCICPCDKICQAKDSFECLEVIKKWLAEERDL